MTVHGAQYPHSHLQLLSQSLKDGGGRSATGLGPLSWWRWTFFCDTRPHHLRPLSDLIL